jgi:hypothetical protein
VRAKGFRAWLLTESIEPEDWFEMAELGLAGSHFEIAIGLMDLAVRQALGYSPEKSIRETVYFTNLHGIIVWVGWSNWDSSMEDYVVGCRVEGKTRFNRVKFRPDGLRETYRELVSEILKFNEIDGPMQP